MSNKKGFSLIELVVVMSILSILATVSSVSYKGYNAKARKQLTKTQMASLIITGEFFKATNKFYIPNMKAMNVPLSGHYKATIKVICSKNNNGSSDDPSSSDVVFKSEDEGEDATDDGTCGWVELKTKEVSGEKILDVKDQCGVGWPAKATGWAGHVFCHYYARSDDEFPRSGGETYAESGFQFEPRDSSEWETIEASLPLKTGRFLKYFQVRDTQSECALKPKGEYGAGSCTRAKEYAMDNIKPIWDDLASKTGNKRRDLLSGPPGHYMAGFPKLVLFAASCKSSGFENCGDGTSKEYSVITLDEGRIANEYEGTASF